MRLRETLFIYGLVMVLAGNTYGAGTHSRTMKNSMEGMKETVISVLKKLNDILAEGKERIMEFSGKEELSKYLEETALMCRENIQVMMKVFSEYPDFAEDKEFIEKAQSISDAMEKNYSGFMNMIEEWVDEHGLPEKDKYDLKSIFDNTWDF